MQLIIRGVKITLKYNIYVFFTLHAMIQEESDKWKWNIHNTGEVLFNECKLVLVAFND